MKTSLEKKLSKILKDAKVYDRIYPNPNFTITKLSSRVLTNDEHETIQYALKYGVVIKPKNNEIFAIAEDIYDQINRKIPIKYLWISIQRLKKVYDLLHTEYIRYR